MIRPPPFSLNDEPALTTIPNVTEPVPERDRSGYTLARPRVWWDERWQVRRQNSARHRPATSSLPVFPSCHNPSPTPLGGSYIDNHKVTVVCPARSGPTKALGTTNLLTDLGPREPYLFKGLCVKSVQYVGGTHMSALG